MNRQEKQRIVEALTADFQQKEAAFLVGVKGLSVADFQDLRRTVRRLGGSVKVIKNSLLERAAREVSEVQQLTPYFSQQIAIVFADDKAHEVVKEISKKAEKNEKIGLVAGIFDKALYQQEGLKRLASLPTKNQLIGQVLGLSQIMIARFLYLLKQASEKSE